MLNLAVMLRESADATPTKPVALFEGGRLTYAELDTLSDRLAAGLQRNGIAPGDTVALQLPNVPQFLIAYFGILKAGAVAVPMNILLKAPEVAFYLEDSAARLLITWAGVLDDALKGAAQAGARDVFVAGGAAEEEAAAPFELLLATEPADRPLAARQPTDTAVVIYTSGTTGRPKGAELTHFQLYMNADIPGRLFGIRPEDVVLTALPLFHVFGLSSILNIAVRFGATMSLIPHFDPGAVLAAIERDRITIFEGVPTMYVAVLGHPKKELIIRGGYNVYPREVEEVLYAHPAVAEAAVIGVPDERLGEEVAAFVAIKAGWSLSESELVAYCKERIAAYKYPRRIEFRDALPRNTVGKILKRMLP